MASEERDKILEKRSSMRSWRSRGGKIPKMTELIGAAIIFLILFGIIASSFWGQNSLSPTTPKKVTPIKTPAITPKPPINIPAPVIKINSPENITYETSSLSLNFTVAGNNLNSVLLWIDEGKNISIPHNATSAKIDFARLDPSFIDEPLMDGPHKLTIFANNTQGKASSRTVQFTVISKTEIGMIGIPVVNNGFEMTLKTITPSVQFISVWLLVNNTQDIEKPFKIGAGTAILDDMNQQYGIIKVPRSPEISQTNLYPQAVREGAIFFERIKEGRSPKKVILYINGNKLEFLLNQS